MSSVKNVIWQCIGTGHIPANTRKMLDSAQALMICDEYLSLNSEEPREARHIAHNLSGCFAHVVMSGPPRSVWAHS